MKTTEQYWGEEFEIVTEVQPDGSWMASAAWLGHSPLNVSGATEQEAVDGARVRVAEAIDRGRTQTGKP